MLVHVLVGLLISHKIVNDQAEALICGFTSSTKGWMLKIFLISPFETGSEHFFINWVLISIVVPLRSKGGEDVRLWLLFTHLVLILITIRKRPDAYNHRQNNKCHECYEAAFLLSIVKSVAAFFIGTMPISQPLVLLITILLLTMSITHDLSASSEKSIGSTARHRLIAIPISLSLADRNAISQHYLTVVSWTEWISVFTASTCEISRTNNDGFRIFVNNSTVAGSLIRDSFLVSSSGWNHVLCYVRHLRPIITNGAFV